MRAWLIQLDEILRGETTRPQRLRHAVPTIRTTGIAVVIAVLAVSYGLCMGSFAMARGIEIGTSNAIQQGVLQTIASMIKMPILFLSTLLITFPSLYVFSALVGSRLKISEVLRLLVAAMAVNLAVLSSLGPIVAFFSVSTPNYYFVLLLNVACCGLGGVLGLGFLLQTLHRLSDPVLANETDTRSIAKPTEPSSEISVSESTLTTESTTTLPRGPLHRSEPHEDSKHVRKVFLIWIFVFGLVGAQMGWVLRPFIGSPTREFSWFRHRESNVLEAIGSAIKGLFG